MVLFSVLYLIFWCHYFLLPRQVSNFCGLDKSTIPPVYLQLSITHNRPSWAAILKTFFPVRVLASFIHLLPVVTLSDNDSKQIAAATSFRMSTLLTLRTFLEKVKKNLVNSENKENLSNYRLLKRKPSVCSTSHHFSKLITVVQFFFRVTPVLRWFQLNFWRPATGYECIAHALAFDRD